MIRALGGRFAAGIKQIDPRFCYNKTQFWHWAYLDYFGTDRAVRRSIENSTTATKTELKVLDIGCGPHQVHRELFESQGFHYFGVDINGTMPIINWNGLEIPMEDETMDYVLISWAMQNMENPQRLLDDVQRVLKKRGIVFIVNSILSPVSFSVNENLVLSKLEKSRMYPEWYRNALKSGFINVEIERKGGIGQILGWKLHLIWWKFYRNRMTLLRSVSWSLFPLFLLFSIATNFAGLIYNFLDNSGRFCSYFTVQARKLG